MIDKFVKRLELADQTFLGLQQPEVLSGMEGARPIKVNARMRQHVSEKREQALSSALDDIHREIYDAKPEWQKLAIQRDLEAIARGEEEGEDITVPQFLTRPELTKEYLISIGRADLTQWGTGREEKKKA